MKKWRDKIKSRLWSWFWSYLYPRTQSALETLFCQNGHTWKGYRFSDGKPFHLCEKCTKTFNE